MTKAQIFDFHSFIIKGKLLVKRKCCPAVWKSLVLNRQVLNEWWKFLLTVALRTHIFRSRLTPTWKTPCVKFAFVSLGLSSAETRSVETRSSLHLCAASCRAPSLFIGALSHCPLDKINSESVYGPQCVKCLTVLDETNVFVQLQICDEGWTIC